MTRGLVTRGTRGATGPTRVRTLNTPCGHRTVARTMDRFEKGADMIIHVFGDLGTARLARVGSQVRFRLTFGIGEQALGIEFDMDSGRAARLRQVLDDVAPAGKQASTPFHMSSDEPLFIAGESSGTF